MHHRSYSKRFLLIGVLILATLLVPNIPTNANALSSPECLTHPGGSTSGQRVLILLQGWTSSADSVDSQRNNWQRVLSEIQDLYQYIVFFSYNSEDAHRYTKNDTLEGINSHHIPLLHNLLRSCQEKLGTNATFDLVGHSMGGTVAFQWAVYKGVGAESFNVRHIITLHSPVNGVDFFSLSSAISSVLLEGAVDAQATKDLIYLAKYVPKSKHFEVATRLWKKGIVFRSIYNIKDAFIWDGPADIDGYSTSHDLGRDLLSGDIGHNRIIHSTTSASDKARKNIRYWLQIGSGSTEPPPSDPVQPPAPALRDHAWFTNVESPADNTVVAPNQPIHKTWRVKNTGNRIWGPDHKLVFIGGNQMGAPNAVNIPLTEPGGVADLSIDITAPDTSGTHRGEWRLRNPQGTFFGDKLWVQIVVPETNNSQPTGMQLTCTNCPSTVTPGQSFRPTVRVSGSVPLLQSRGDMLRNTDGNRYGAWEFVAVNGAVNQGQSYDFTFYEQNPITAPNNEGVYESKWRVWQNGGWVGPELTIRFEVKAGGGGSNHAPNPPTLTGPGDWAVYTGNGGINLQAQQNGDPNGDAITHYYFEIFESAQTPNSGWITSNSWAPAGLGNYGFQWRVKVRDARGAESGWSEVRHFNINDPTPQIQSFTWTWCHEPWGPADKVCFCAKTTGGGLELKLNSANDGSDRGAWKVIGHGDTNLNCDNDNDRPPNWGQLEAEAGSYRVRLYARPKGEGGWPAAATADVVVSLPPNQRPGSPSGIAPAYDEYVNTKTVKLDWQQTYRTTNYRLQISLDPNFGTALVDTHLPADVSEYTYTFADEYATVYWQVLATGPYGTHDSGRRQFHIDLTPPSSSIHVLPAVTTDTKFNVNWGGSDARVGLRWYHVQVRDGNRSDSQWSDWFVNTSKNGELFAGQTGHTYYFRVRAMDQVGNWEEWPAGDGDTYTTVNPAAAPPTAWWNNAYTYKRNLIIRNNDGDAMPAHYPMRLHFDDTTNPTAAELYNGSLAPTKGDDLRIVYTNQTEIDRFVQRFTPNAIDLWFPLQAGLGGSESNHDGYQLYYGNASAGSPPSTINTIFLPETDNNTLGLWHFQEGSGGTVYDSSGRSHHGALSNGSWMDGYLGNAVSFNGANTTLTLGNHSDFNNGGAITLEAWIYPTRRSWGMVFMKGIDGNGHYRLNLNGDGNIEFVITTQGGERSILGSTNLQANQWYHVAGVHDGGNAMWIYVNGVQEREKTDAAPLSGRDYPLYIGNAPWWNGMAFAGLIQHARISNVARRNFPYAHITIPPSAVAGSPIAPPIPGAPDLVVLGLNTYPNPAGGVMIEALVQNGGNRETQNGFYTDLYIDHLPTGAGDYTGSAQFWVNSPIAAGATVTLTTVLTNFNGGGVSAAQSQVPAAEVTHLLYMQTDSAGVVPDADKTNNILSTGVEVCLANPDAFEGDDTVAQAAILTLNQGQSHNFSDAGDQDWVKFNAEAGQAYTFSTRNLGPAADTYLYLYSTDGATLLTANDDGNDSLASQIQWTAPAATTYYLLVRHWNPNVAGCGSGYELLVESGQTAPTPTFTPTPTATPDTSQPVTPTPTATTVNPPDVTDHRLYLPNVQQNSNSTLPNVDATPTTAPTTGFTVSGTIYHSTMPLPNIKIELIPGDSSKPPIASSNTNSEGKFIFAQVAPGSYMLKKYGPTTDYIAWSASSLQVQSSDVVVTLDLPKRMTLLSPPKGSAVNTTSPTFCWQALPSATKYTFQLNQSASWVLVEHINGLTTTCYSTPKALQRNTQHTWQIDAYDGLGHWVGTTDGAFTLLTP